MKVYLLTKHEVLIENIELYNMFYAVDIKQRKLIVIDLLVFSRFKNSIVISLANLNFHWPKIYVATCQFIICILISIKN